MLGSEIIITASNAHERNLDNGCLSVLGFIRVFCLTTLMLIVMSKIRDSCRWNLVGQLVNVLECSFNERLQAESDGLPRLWHLLARTNLSERQHK